MIGHVVIMLVCSLYCTDLEHILFMSIVFFRHDMVTHPQYMPVGSKYNFQAHDDMHSTHCVCFWYLIPVHCCPGVQDPGWNVLPVLVGSLVELASDLNEGADA